MIERVYFIGPSDFSVGFERLTNNASTARDAKDAKERQ
jgi:hypothetical protein